MKKGEWYFTYLCRDTRYAFSDCDDADRKITKEILLEATTKAGAIAEANIRWDKAVRQVKAWCRKHSMSWANGNGPWNPRVIYKIDL